MKQLFTWFSNDFIAQGVRRRTTSTRARPEARGSAAKGKEKDEITEKVDTGRSSTRKKRTEAPNSSTTAAPAPKRKRSTKIDQSESEVSSEVPDGDDDESPPTARRAAVKRKRKTAAESSADAAKAGFSPKPDNVFQSRTKRRGASSSSGSGAIIKGDEADDASVYESVDESSVQEDSAVEEEEDNQPKKKRRKLKDESDMDVDQDTAATSASTKATGSREPAITEKKPPARGKKAAFIGAAAKRRLEAQKRAASQIKVEELQMLKEFESPDGKAPVFRDEPAPFPTEIAPPTFLAPPERLPIVEPSAPSLEPVFDSLASAPELKLEDFNIGTGPSFDDADASRPFRNVGRESAAYRNLAYTYRPPPTAGYKLPTVPPITAPSQSPHTPYRGPEYFQQQQQHASTSFMSRIPRTTVAEHKPIVPPQAPPKAPSTAPPRPVIPSAPSVPMVPLMTSPKPIRVLRDSSQSGSGIGSTKFWSICVLICFVVGSALVFWASPRLFNNEARTLEELNRTMDRQAQELFDKLFYELSIQRGAYECGESDHIGFIYNEISEKARELFPEHPEGQLDAVLQRFKNKISEPDGPIRYTKELEYVVLPEFASRSVSCVVQDWAREYMWHIAAVVAAIIAVLVLFYRFRASREREEFIRGLISRIQARLIAQQRIGLASPINSPGSNAPKRWIPIDQLADEFLGHSKKSKRDRDIWTEVRHRMDLDSRVRNAPRNFRGMDVDTWEWMPEYIPDTPGH